jgi:hypothetical protein
MTPPPHILIDTCILLNLVSPNTYSELLRKVKQLADEKKVVLLVPDTLAAEWHRNKGDKRKRIIDGLSKEATLQSTIHHAKAPYTKAQLDKLIAILDSQFTDIDNLIEITAIRIKEEDYPATLILNQQRNKKAPFTRSGRDVIGDADIIYGSLDYVRKNAIPSLYFVTTNSTDFSISPSRPGELHPDYPEAFPEIDILFYTDIRQVISKLDALGIGISEKRFEFAEERPDMEEPFIDRNQHILDQVYEYFQELFSELTIIPQNLFSGQYPFILDRNSHYHSSPFTLVTDNEELYELLQVKVFDDSIEDSSGKHILDAGDEDKIRFIIVTLRRNYIWYVSLKNREPVEIIYQVKQVRCDCAQCSLYRFNWKQTLEALYTTTHTDTDTVELRTRIKAAYIKYQLGDFKTSALEFEQIFVDPATTVLQKYICAFNLKLLSKLLQYEFNQEAVVQQLEGRIEGIDLGRVKDEAIQSKPVFKRIVEWIDSKKFYSESREKMLYTSENMRDLFYSGNGGNIEYTNEALEAYAVTDDFLNYNYVVYNKFSEYAGVTRAFTETLFASYGSSRYLGGKLRRFWDYVLEKLVMNVHSNVIRLFRQRYDTRNAVYDHHDGNRFELTEAVVNFFTNYATVSATTSFEKSYYYNDQLTTIAMNLLQFLQAVDLKYCDTEAITDSFVTFLREGKQIDFRLLEELARLLNIQGSHFPVRLYERTVELIVFHKELHHEDLCDAVCMQLKKRDFTMNEEQFQFVMTSIVPECPDCKRQHSRSMLADLSEIMTKEQKGRLRGMLTEKLDESFDASDYYREVMAGLVNFESRFHQQYETYSRAVDMQRLRPSFWSMPEYADPIIDQYLNYIFRFELEIPAELKKRILDFSDYYKWLLNPDEFDYTRFDSEWLTVHFTSNYKAWLRKSKALKQYMIDTLWDNFDKVLEKKFLQIYAMPFTKEIK